MIVNGQSLLEAKPIKDMLINKVRNVDGVSYGLVEVGYDIRIAETVMFMPEQDSILRIDEDGVHSPVSGSFCLASIIEEFQMPDDLMGIVHDKSTWARLGLSVFNTVIEPGWKGFLTLELAFKGSESFTIPAGAGIAQVIFHRLENKASYNGAYQNQAAGPVGSVIKS